MTTTETNDDVIRVIANFLTEMLPFVPRKGVGETKQDQAENIACFLQDHLEEHGWVLREKPTEDLTTTEEAMAFALAVASPLDPPPGFTYLGRATQVGPNDEDVYGYEWPDTGRRIYLDKNGRSYRFLGVSVSGDNVFTWAEDNDDPDEASFWRTAGEAGKEVVTDDEVRDMGLAARPDTNPDRPYDYPEGHYLRLPKWQRPEPTFHDKLIAILMRAGVHDEEECDGPEDLLAEIEALVRGADTRFSRGYFHGWSDHKADRAYGETAHKDLTMVDRIEIVENELSSLALDASGTDFQDDIDRAQASAREALRLSRLWIKPVQGGLTDERW